MIPTSNSTRICQIDSSEKLKNLIQRAYQGDDIYDELIGCVCV